MKLVIDDKIPYIRGFAEQLGETVYHSGATLCAADVRDADALIVRTRTRCDRALLEGSRVRFIATATIGYDHLDTDYLAAAGIAWTNCPGCNADSVAQYVESCLLLLARSGRLDLSHTTVGIVGVGHVGRRVADAARALGCRLLLNDPPRQAREGGDFVSLDVVAAQADVVCMHTPLTTSGAFPTYHLADAAFFAALRRRPVFLNAGRGECVDTAALLATDRVSQCIIDTWENEPSISRALLERTYIGTPHIAGYSADGKANATRMALEAVAHHFGHARRFDVQPPALPASLVLSDDPVERKLQLYNPFDDSRALKAHPEQFEQLRGNYPLRREHS